MDTAANPVPDPRARRRTFLVDRSFQLKWTFIIVAVGVVISAGLGYFIVRLNLTNTDLLELDAVYADKVSEFDAMAIYYLIGFVVVMALALFTWGIFMTHRVAGPIFIISRYLGQLGQGQIPQTRPLRKGDDLREFFDTFSSMIAGFRERNLAEAALLAKASAELGSKGGNAELIGSLDELASSKKAWEQAD
jgi:hypothetical protein